MLYHRQANGKWYRNMKCQVSFRDPSGQSTYRQIFSIYIRNVEGLILIYDVSAPDTL